VLSRITEPSAGRVEIRGRVASLLEIGTGFHAELTGRENIFLNGVILGMSRAEVRRKFDEIVAFAEVEKFLDTPVKRYSSGMYVRLAFAVAAHLEPEILIVDEVLAVGDAEFQNKCLGKMQDVAGHGRTVLFVSHNMAAIEAICTRALLFEGGRIVCQGVVESVTSEYTSRSELAYLMSFAPDSKSPSICRISVNAEALEFRNLIVDVEFVSPWPLQTAVGGLLLKTVKGEPVWGSNCRFHPYESQIKGSARGVLRCQSRGLPITPGQYVLSVWLGDRHERYDSKLDVLKISIAEDRINPLRPPASGHLDWPAVWEGQC
jgi:lipopolysaccharide transport system ATP-binding protein